MNVKTFIDRPIFAGVISIMILLLGLISLAQLPVEQFPEIAPPTVSVSAAYAGANAETVQKSVLVPLEEAINGVENMMYMVSSATNSGSASIQIYFRQGTDGDMAMVNVQNRIASAQSLLPAEVTRSGVTVRKRQTSRIKTLAVYSPDNSFDRKFITNYLKINIEPRLSRIAGVGEVTFEAVTIRSVYGSIRARWQNTASCLRTSRQCSRSRTSRLLPEHSEQSRRIHSAMYSSTADVTRT